ncbi:3'-5' exonuclease [Chroococcidiopsis sp.]|uniref:3'-5' exonuclease n=1 Tax=Chroococcidiopsis sp. TaxID=3088168 RepID=UPI003F3ED819
MIKQLVWTCNEQHALDKWEAFEWAKKIYDSADIVYLDTETTGLHNAYPVEIAVLSRHGSPLLNTLVKPPVPSETGAERVHGITAQMLEDAPTFPEIYPLLSKVLSDRTCIIYNAAFDCGILRNCYKYYGLEEIKFMPQCAMEWYAQYVGDWNSYYGNYKWQKLPNAGHRAAEDAYAARELIKEMTFPPSSEVEYNRMFPPVQLYAVWKEVGKVRFNWKKPGEKYYPTFDSDFKIKVPILELRGYNRKSNPKLCERASAIAAENPSIPTTQIADDGIPF